MVDEIINHVGDDRADRERLVDKASECLAAPRPMGHLGWHVGGAHNISSADTSPSQAHACQNWREVNRDDRVVIAMHEDKPPAK